MSWATADPDRLAARLTSLGFALPDRRLLAFPAGEIRLILAPGRPPERLLHPRWEPASAGRVAQARHPNGVSDLVALGWATVDADRASAAAQADSGTLFTPLPDDRHLGARVRGSSAREPATLLLEPATEGRLAATLARAGEGPAAVYLAAGNAGLAHLAAALGSTGRAVVRRGPLGPALLLPGGAAWGPHLLVVSPPGTALDARTPGTITP